MIQDLVSGYAARLQEAQLQAVAAEALLKERRATLEQVKKEMAALGVESHAELDAKISDLEQQLGQIVEGIDGSLNSSKNRS